MNDNLDLWESVEKTNPKHTKKITFGRGITAIDPYRQVRNATEKFGPVGIGWGWSVERVEYLPTSEIGLLIRMWHTSKDNTFDQWGQASLYIDNAEKKKDTDCFKKATTDGITKCLSFIGFNADVFLGKFDDNKYVQEMKDEFKEVSPANKKAVAQILDALIKNDSVWIQTNWAGCISTVWGELDEDVTSKLNAVINQK